MFCILVKVFVISRADPIYFVRTQIQPGNVSTSAGRGVTSHTFAALPATAGQDSSELQTQQTVTETIKETIKDY